MQRSVLSLVGLLLIAAIQQAAGDVAPGTELVFAPGICNMIHTGTPGGFTALTQDQLAKLKDVAQAVAQAFAESISLPCTVTSADATSGCVQIVAGSKFELGVAVTYACPVTADNPEGIYSRTVTATVFKPLGNHAQLQISDLQDSSALETALPPGAVEKTNTPGSAICVGAGKGAAGGFSPLPSSQFSDTKYVGYANLAAAKYLSKVKQACGSGNPAPKLQSATVTQGCTQVVAGTKTQLRIELVYSCADSSTITRPVFATILESLKGKVSVTKLEDAPPVKPSPAKICTKVAKMGQMPIQGGFMTLQPSQLKALKQVAKAVAAAYPKYYGTVSCGAGQGSPSVKFAVLQSGCQQVVRGLNLEVQVAAEYSCKGDKTKTIAKTLLAEVYVPPGKNAKPSVNKVWAGN